MFRKICTQILFCGSFLLILSCNRAVKNEISKWELKNNGLRVTRISSLSPFDPIFGADSMQWLQTEYNLQYQAKLNDISLQIAEKNKNLTLAWLEYDTIANSTLKKIYKPILEGMELKLSQLKQIQEIYVQHPEQTQFGMLSNKINYYNQRKSNLLGYRIQANFEGIEGLLPLTNYQRNYFFNISQNKILTDINLAPEKLD